MAIGRAYRIKKDAVKGYGYTSPPKKRAFKRNGPRFAANGSVTHIAAINGRGSYRSARRTMSGLSANARRTAARSSLSQAKKTAFAHKMRAAKGKGRFARNVSWADRKRNRAEIESHLSPRARASRAANRKRKIPRKTLAKLRRLPRLNPPAPKKKSRRRQATATTATRKTTMARKVRRRKKSAARSAPKRRVAKRRSTKKRRKVARKTAAAPKRKRRKARKTTLKRNGRRRVRRLKRNYGTTKGARRGWRTRKATYKPTAYRKAKRKGSKKRRSRKASAVAAPRKRRRKGKRKLSMKKSAVAARKARRARKGGMKANRRRRRSRRGLSANRRRRGSRRRLTSNRRRRSRARRSLSPNRRRRRSRRRMSSNRRRSRRGMRRNGRRLFRKNGVGDTLLFIAKTGGIALAGLVGHKVVTNALTTYVLNKIFGSPAAVVATSPTTSAVVAPATSGLGGLSLDPNYQKLIGSFLAAAGGILVSAKVIKDPTVRNTVMTGIAVSFMHTGFLALLSKFAPNAAFALAGESDGTAARLSAMYGLGAGASLQPRYASIGRPMGEYFSSGVNGLGEYFSSGVNGLGEYFSSGVNGLGSLPAYEAAAGYGANPDLMEAAAGMGAQTAMSTNHIDPHGDLDRELTIAEAAAGIGALPSYEAAAGYGAIDTVPSASTWIPGSANGQLWAGTRSISAPQSGSEMVPAGILQTDGGQGVFG